MAVVTVKSTAITNRDATPRVINDGRFERSVVKNSYGLCAVASGDSIGSKYIIAQVPSTAVVKDVKLSISAITTCAGDIGLYRPTQSDGTAGTVISAAFLAKREQPIWQAAGLTSDPGGLLDVVVTLTAAAGSAGNISADVEYMDNGS
jgi:hypothetical protein